MQSLQISEVRKVNGLETNKQEQPKKAEFSKTAQNRGQKYVNSEFKNRGFLFFPVSILNVI